MSTSLAQHYDQALRAVFTGRKLILIGGSVAGLAGVARGLRALGAERPFIVGAGLGGTPPSQEEAEWASLELRAGTALEWFRLYEARLSHLPDEVRARIDAYDPDRAAIALGHVVLSELSAVAGRPNFAARPRAWIALEDKLTIDGFWDEIGVARAPTLHVRAVEAELRAAARRLDSGAGTVWSGDAREGVSGGAEDVRWVRDDDDAREATRFFATRADRVRVMPFLEGIPCSVHGLVTPDGVAVFRPVEQLTLRHAGPVRLRYAGVATFWDPDPADREQMRDVARRAGHALADRVHFGGAFTVDGVLTADGFSPTELNPRIGTGLAVLDSVVEGLPLGLVALCAQAGRPMEYRPAELEQLVLEQADARRGGGARVAASVPEQPTRQFELAADGDGYRLRRGEEPAAAKLTIGPSAIGGFLDFAPVPEHTPVGPALAPRACQAFALAERELGVQLGTFEPARAVRRS